MRLNIGTLWVIMSENKETGEVHGEYYDRWMDKYPPKAVMDTCNEAEKEVDISELDPIAIWVARLAIAMAEGKCKPRPCLSVPQFLWVNRE